MSGVQTETAEMTEGALVPYTAAYLRGHCCYLVRTVASRCGRLHSRRSSNSAQTETGSSAPTGEPFFFAPSIAGFDASTKSRPRSSRDASHRTLRRKSRKNRGETNGPEIGFYVEMPVVTWRKTCVPWANARTPNATLVSRYCSRQFAIASLALTH